MSAVENLRKCQRQLDMDGCEIGVSRQALDEVLALLDALKVERDEARDAAQAYAETAKMQREWKEEAEARALSANSLVREAVEFATDISHFGLNHTSKYCAEKASAFLAKADRHLEAEKAALEARLEGEGWQPIETAPHDGPQIDAWVRRTDRSVSPPLITEYRVCDIWWGLYDTGMPAMRGGPDWVKEGNDHGVPYDERVERSMNESEVAIQVLFWMPRPPAPMS